MGTEKVEQTTMNEGRTNAGIDTRLTQRPVRYEIVDAAGNIFGDFDSAQAAAAFAHRRWPGQEQDPERSGKGWDLQVVGS